jgi:hypothetical protein
MTVDELLAREAIHDTMARYNMAGDRARVEDFVAIFTEDGVLEGDNFAHEGRDALRAWMTGWRTPPAGAAAPAPSASSAKRKFVRHNITTSQIDFTGPDTAKARTYFYVVTEIGPDHAGHYVDEFRKVGDRWLISRRRANLDWRAAESTFGMSAGK